MQVNNALTVFRDEETVIKLSDFALDLPTQRKFKDNGAMIAPATIARTGIMEYRARECGALFADRDPNSIVRVMTEAADLFDKDSIASYHSAPITIGHPKEDVTTDNSKELQKGHLDGVPFADEESGMLAANIVLSDSEAVDTVEAGTSQLSSGHTCMLVMADENDDFDAKKTEIRANHVAIVARGRAGAAEIADEEDETAIKLADAESKISVKDEEISALNAKLDTAKEEVESYKSKLSDAETKFNDEIESRVKEKLDFLTIAAKLVDSIEDISKLNIHDAKIKIMKDGLGKDFSDKDEVYVEARFDGYVESFQDDDSNSIAAILAQDAINNKDTEIKPSVNKTARDRMVERNSKANRK